MLITISAIAFVIVYHECGGSTVSIYVTIHIGICAQMMCNELTTNSSQWVFLGFIFLNYIGICLVFAWNSNGRRCLGRYGVDAMYRFVHIEYAVTSHKTLCRVRYVRFDFCPNGKTTSILICVHLLGDFVFFLFLVFLFFVVCGCSGRILFPCLPSVGAVQLETIER